MSSQDNLIVNYINSLGISTEKKAELLKAMPKTLAEVSLWLKNHKEIPVPSPANPFIPFKSEPAQADEVQLISPDNSASILPFAKSAVPFICNNDADWGLGIERTQKVDSYAEMLPQKAPSSYAVQGGNTSKSAQKVYQDKAVEVLHENIEEAHEILSSQSLGAVKTFYDEKIKSDNSRLKTSNVAKVLAYQQAGEVELIKANEGNLTKRQYYLDNKERLKEMILTRANVLEISGKNLKPQEVEYFLEQYIERELENSDLKTIKGLQQQFASMTPQQEAKKLKEMIDSAQKTENSYLISVKENKVETTALKNSKKGKVGSSSIPAEWNSDKPISFEEVYKWERGTEYSEQKVKNYLFAQKSMEAVANAYNKKQQFVDFVEELAGETKLSSQQISEKILSGYEQYYAMSEDGGKSQLQKVLESSQSKIRLTESGIDLSAYKTEQEKQQALKDLLHYAGVEKEKDFEKFLKGKTVEDYQKEYETASSALVGEENASMLAEAMKNDNENVVQRWTGNTSSTGMGMMAVGGVLLFTPLNPLGASLVTTGSVAAIGGMAAKNGLEIADFVTKEQQTSEEFQRVVDDLVFDAGGFIVGMGAGKAGVSAFSKVIDKKLAATFSKEITAGNRSAALKEVFSNPDNLKSFLKAGGVKISSDFLISYTGDLVMMGALDTEHDWQSLLQANLMGVMVGMSGDLKSVSGTGRGKNHASAVTGKAVTQKDYAKNLAGKEVSIKDNSGNAVTGTVTGIKVEQGRAQVEVNGKYYSTDDVAVVNKRNEIKTKIQEGIKVKNAGIAIPDAVKFAAPNEKFAETDEAFRKIVQNRAEDIKKLDKIENIDEFCKEGFEILKQEMGIEDSNIKLEITNDTNEYDVKTNTVRVSRNWAGHSKKHVQGQGDRAEIFGGMAHELNHFLQFKEIILNLDAENSTWNIFIDKIQSNERGLENIQYLLEKYPDNIELKDYFDKAKKYQDNYENYVEPEKDYAGYRKQTIEAESFRRGDIVVEEYRKVTNKPASTAEPLQLQTKQPKQTI